MTRPILLDLFCGAGGAAVGYHRAGFDVVGVDIDPQPNYPFTFHRADALTVLAELAAWRGVPAGSTRRAGVGNLRAGFADSVEAIHASPPCQAHTTMSNRRRGRGMTADSHLNLLVPTFDALDRLDVPWIVENVPGAKRFMRAPVTLTGGMFGLSVHRPRLFSSSIGLVAPPKARVPRPAIGVYGKAPDGRLLWRRADGSEQHAASSVTEACDAMGIDWPVAWREVAEAIPPSYTEHLGRQLLCAVRPCEAAA